MGSVARFRLVVGLLFCLVLLPVQAAFAHAQLLSTDPAENAVLHAPPATMGLTFNEPVSPLAIRLIGPDGSARDLTGDTTGGTTSTVALPTDIAPGTHVLSWRVVSTDGHPIGGSLIFSIGAATGAAAVDTASDPMVSVALWASKALLFLALFVGVGGAAFTAIAPLPNSARSVALALSIAGIAIAPTTLGLQGLDALGLTMASVADGKVWATGFSTSYGATVIAATAAFILAFYALFSTGQRPRYLGWVAAGIAALSLALSGHASAAAPQWLTRPAVFVHIAGLLFWVGALLPLWQLLRERSRASDDALAAFSEVIPLPVMALVASGVTLTVIQLGPPGEQWLTGYGVILGTKLLLLGLLFALALWNRLALTAPALSGDTAARSHLRTSIGLEMIIIVAVLALVAGWRFTPPPRALAAAPIALVAADPIIEHLMDGSTMAMVTIDPGSTGTVRFQAMISDLEHNPKAVQSVSVLIASPALGVEPIRRDAIEADGIWTINDLTIPFAGNWQVEIEVRVTRFELARPRGEIVIR